MIKLYCIDSKLQDRPIFGIMSENKVCPMIPWIFYFLGTMIESSGLKMTEDFELESHSLGYTYLIKEYMPIDAEIIAKSIFKEITKRVKK